ncbi:MAG: hypothetical protein IPL92_11325 [Saprospiraceae bacterium]|nr:hypothetical protein [Candidatus Opimibacter iunctus]
MDFVNHVVIVFLLISILSCRKGEKMIEDCQTKDDLEFVNWAFDSSAYAKADFLIWFTSNDSWGAFSNSIKIYKQNSEYKLESSFVIRKTLGQRRDTTYFETVLTAQKIDSLLDRINQLKCHPYKIDQFGETFDGNYKKFMYKSGNLIKGWMWQDGILSGKDDGEIFVDSIKVKALALEGMLYRFSGAGTPDIVYSFDSECENDSIKVAIYPTRGDNISLSIKANHPKYKIEENVDGFIEGKINCRDTFSFAKDLEIIVTTKESNKMPVTSGKLGSEH